MAEAEQCHDESMQRIAGLVMPDALASDFNSLLGSCVVLHGLNARPDLNGKQGRVMSWHEKQGRAGVHVDGECKALAIKPTNLRKMEDVHVRDDECPRVLTIGDGDLSFSVALARAFGNQIRLTATTLLKRSELLETYAAAPAMLAELQDRNVCVRHDIDATSLHMVDPPLGIHVRILLISRTHVAVERMRARFLRLTQNDGCSGSHHLQSPTSRAG